MLIELFPISQRIFSAQSDKDKDFYENKCAALDSQIDQLVYELYGLTDEEIKLIEAEAK